MTPEEMKNYMLENKEILIGEFLITRNNCLHRIVDITEDGIQTVPVMMYPHNLQAGGIAK